MVPVMSAESTLGLGFKLVALPTNPNITWFNVLAYICAFCAFVSMNTGTFQLVKIYFVIPKDSAFIFIMVPIKYVMRRLFILHKKIIETLSFAHMTLGSITQLNIHIIQYV